METRDFPKSIWRKIWQRFSIPREEAKYMCSEIAITVEKASKREIKYVSIRTETKYIPKKMVLE